MNYQITLSTIKFLTLTLLTLRSTDSKLVIKRQTNACQFISCQNGGSCIFFSNIATCECPNGWTGSRCEIAGQRAIPQSALCASQFCLNGGRCIQLTSARATCFCLPGFTGTNCQNSSPLPTQSQINICQRITCFNGGQCVQLSSNVGYCQCPSSYVKFYFLRNFSN
jgi:hypothetical protein